MSVIHFNWTDETRYRVRFRESLKRARSTAALSPQGGLTHVYLSPGYQAVIERPVIGLDLMQRLEAYPVGLSYIEGCALLIVADETVPAQLGRSLFLHQKQIVWIDNDGQEFVADTVFAVLDGTVLIATAKEFPLDERYLVDRQLFRAEVAHVCDELRRYKGIQSEES